METGPSFRSRSARFALGGGDGLIAKGVGGGMTAKPLGFIVIDRNGVRFQKTPQPVA